MKKIVAAIGFGILLIRSSLFAPNEKVAETHEAARQRQSNVLSDMAKRSADRLALLRERAERDAQEKARQKALEEARKKEEERKKEELQQKLDELKAQEEKAAKEAADRAEAEKRKREQADPRKLVSDALGDLFAAVKKYNADDVKAGDALFKKVGIGLDEALSVFTYEEIKKIVTSMELKPERHFLILQNLIEAYADHAKVIGGSHLKVLGDFIKALFETISVEQLQKFLTTDANIKTVEGVQKLLLQLDQHFSGMTFEELTSSEQQALLLASKIKNMMINFSSELVEVLKNAEKKNQEALAQMLTHWIRNIPVRTAQDREQLAYAIRLLPVDLLPADPGVLHDLLLDLNVSKELPFLTILRKKYLAAVLKSGVAQDLRACLQMLKDVLPFPDLFKLQRTYLETVANPATIQEISDRDINLIISTFRSLLPVFDEHQWSDARALLTKVINSVDSAIAAIAAQREKTVGTKKFADLGEPLGKLLAFKEQLDGMVLPKGVWESIVDYVKGSKSSPKFEPDIMKWNPDLRAHLIFGLTETNYKNNRFVSVEEFAKALQRLMDVYHFYDGSPEMQKVILTDARRYILNDDDAKLLELIGGGYGPEHQKKQQALYKLIGLNHNLLVFIASLADQRSDFKRHFLLDQAIREVIDSGNARYLHNLEGVVAIDSDAVLPVLSWIEGLHFPREPFAFKALDLLSEQQFEQLLTSFSGQELALNEVFIWRDLIQPMKNAQRLNRLNKVIDAAEDRKIGTIVNTIITRFSTKDDSSWPEIAKYEPGRTKMLQQLGRRLDQMDDRAFKLMLPPETHADFFYRRLLGAKINLLFDTLSYIQNRERARIIVAAIEKVLNHAENRDTFDIDDLNMIQAKLGKYRSEQKSASATTSASMSQASSGAAGSTASKKDGMH